MGNVPSTRSPTSQDVNLVTTVDGGFLDPQGLYAKAAKDYDERLLRRWIMERLVAPFYIGLAEPMTFLHANNELEDSVEAKTIKEDVLKEKQDIERLTIGRWIRLKCLKSADPPQPSETKPPVINMERYIDTVECPICFLYYPSNINFTRCCRQPICTECFVQIKRPVETQPISCPFCVEPHFGVTYQPPSVDPAPISTVHDPGSASSAASTITAATVTSTDAMARSFSDCTTMQSVAHRNALRSLGAQVPGVVSSEALRPLPVLPPASSSSNRNRRRSQHGRAGRRLRNLYPGGEGEFLRTFGDARSQIDREYYTALRDWTVDLEEAMLAEAIRQSLQVEERSGQGEGGHEVARTENEVSTS